LAIQPQTRPFRIDSGMASESEAHAVSADTIRELEILVAEMEVALRAGIVTDTTSKKPWSDRWRRLFSLR
jgi:hypothetical protein